MLVLAVLVSALAGAAPSSTAGGNAFDEGRALYDALEYEQAVFRFQEVALRQDLPPPERAVALTWLGLSYAGAGDLEAARRAFTDAARSDPDVALPVEVAPSLQQLFDEARAAAVRDSAAAQPAAPAPAPAPDTSGQRTTPAEGGGDVLALAGVATGAALLLGGLGASALCAVTYADAQDRTLFQTDAKAKLDSANLQLTVASALIPVGVAVGAVSGWLLLDGGGP